MLEAIRERAQGWIAKVILGLLVIPFALWGIDSYFKRDGKEPPVAEVDGGVVTQREFIKALKDQEEALGAKVEEKALRKQVMDQLVNTRVLSQAAMGAGFSVNDPQVQAVLMGVEIFQENGKFSEARLDAWLRNRGMGRGELLGLIAQELLLKQVQIGYGEGALASKAAAERLATLLGQQREVNEAIFDAKAYLPAVKIDDKAVNAEYQAHQNDYTTPAQVRVQYLTLSQAGLEAGIQVGDDQARKFYEANPARFQEPEQRRAAHILIKVDEGADAKTRQAAKAKAEQLLAELQKNPGKFADLARQQSQDPVSGAKGGDLGVFTRDMMVKPFADAVWAMKSGEIRGLVESQFGYHIIRLDGILAGAKLGYEVVKADIIREIRQQEAQKRFAEMAERFSNRVYEQPESLDPAAKEFNLKVEESGWLSKGRPAQPDFLANPKLQDALFRDDALKKRQNIEAVEVAPNTLVSARVVDFRPAGVRPLADVANEIRARLANAEARKQAIEAGKKALGAAQAGTAPASLSAPMTISRMRPLNLPAESVKAVFRAGADKLPGWVGVESAEGFRLYRLNRVTAGEVPAGMNAKIHADLRKLVAQEEMRAYLESAKARAKISITPGALEPKAE
ncbi:MAG TPA: SurA N-terminal domain-containing protein [Thiobacillaceae bacterium]|nr:SurA N-terminal domain-containing protein [Thiobacillaceae bacterium]HNH89313.1 SurA N-terminal domain-containing protein [Thiobacillaceae bacterium]